MPLWLVPVVACYEYGYFGTINTYCINRCWMSYRVVTYPKFPCIEISNVFCPSSFDISWFLRRYHGIQYADTERKLRCVKYRNGIVSISFIVYRYRMELDSDIDTILISNTINNIIIQSAAAALVCCYIFCCCCCCCLLLLLVVVHLPPEVVVHTNSSRVCRTYWQSFIIANENTLLMLIVLVHPLVVHSLLCGIGLLYLYHTSHGHHGHSRSRLRASAHRGEAPLYAYIMYVCLRW